MFTKDPASVLDYGVDWSAWLGSDTISGSTWSAPAPVTAPALEIVANSTTTSTTRTRVILSGGAAGIVYTIANRITTAGGLTEERSFKIAVEEK